MAVKSFRWIIAWLPGPNAGSRVGTSMPANHVHMATCAFLPHSPRSSRQSHCTAPKPAHFSVALIADDRRPSRGRGRYRSSLVSNVRKPGRTGRSGEMGNGTFFQGNRGRAYSPGESDGAEERAAYGRQMCAKAVGIHPMARVKYTAAPTQEVSLLLSRRGRRENSRV